MQDIDYFQTAPTPSSTSVIILAAGVFEHGLKIFISALRKLLFARKLDHEICMKLPDECCDMSGKTVRLN